jgi:peptidoglycan-N-acetylglucosamine deacetylase
LTTPRANDGRDPRPGRFVAMTFDDGPDPVWTPRILAELADAGARATFFVISPPASRHEQLIDAIGSAGHEIGLHCARHLRHTETSRSVIEADTVEALGTLAALGVSPTRWRLPWGACAEWSASIARAHGLAIVGWTADTHDWRGDSATAMLESIGPAIDDRAIVLMHDGLGPGARREGCVETARLVGPLTRTIREHGCEPVSLAAMAEIPRSR